MPIIIYTADLNGTVYLILPAVLISEYSLVSWKWLAAYSGDDITVCGRWLFLL